MSESTGVPSAMHTPYLLAAMQMALFYLHVKETWLGVWDVVVKWICSDSRGAPCPRSRAEQQSSPGPPGDVDSLQVTSLPCLLRFPKSSLPRRNRI